MQETHTTEPKISDSLAIVLDTLNSESVFSGGFLENLLTREEWANVLGVNRRTICRWEAEIINDVAPIKREYYDSDRGARSHYLDNYQRFILSCLYIVKGCLLRKNKPNQKVINFLKSNFSNLKRKQFETWVKQNG